MNCDYDFEPPLDRMTTFMRTPMLKSSARNSHTAVLTLNLLAQLAIDSSDAAAQTGRLLTTAHILHNVAYQDTSPSQKWIMEFNSEAPGNPSGYLIVYRDLSCLIARIDDAQSEKMGCQALEILPIPLYITERNVATNDVEQIKFIGGKTAGSDVELCVQCVGRNNPLFSHECYKDHGSYVIDAARKGLIDAAAAWSCAFKSLPHLREPNQGEPRTGTFDLTAPAPRPELSGLPYAWPVMLNWSDTSPEDVESLEQYLHKAAAYLMARNSEYISALQVTVWAGRPTKPRSKPKVELKANFTKLRSSVEEDISHYTQEMENLLKDHRAPFDYSQREGSEIVKRSYKNGRRIISQPHRLARVTIREPLSAHAQIEAIVDFS